MDRENRAVLLFDGVCNLCSSLVVFVLKRDRRGYFLFASLQSEKGRELLAGCGLKSEKTDSLVLIEKGRCYTRSSAALRAARRLAGAWKLFYLLIIVPPFLRNPVYDFVARRRYRWFGKKDVCFVPGPADRERFLD